MEIVGEGRRAGQDLEVVGCVVPLTVPLWLPRLVGEAVVGDQQGAGIDLPTSPFAITAM